MSRSVALPVAESSTKIRASKMSRRRAAVLIAVHVVIAGHIAHWWLKGSTMTPLEPSEAMEFSKHSVINAGLIFFAAAILLTALLGRLFCGWGCHVVALQDFSRWLLAKMGIRPKPLRSRILVWVPAIAFIYMFIWPIVYRLWIGDALAIRGTHLTTQTFWATFPGWFVGGLTLVFCGFVIIYLLGAKGFCTYACPYGAIFGLADRFAVGRIRVTDACKGCGHCTAVCTSNVRVHEEVRDFGMVVDPGCMKCMDCVSVCPNDALYYGFGAPQIFSLQKPARHKLRDYTWPEEVLLGFFFVATFFALRGLYGLVPFLFALGLAAIAAFLGVQFARLFYRPNLTLHRWSLKRNGKLVGWGYALAFGMVILTIFTGHSGLIQYHTKMAHHLYGQIEKPRLDSLASTAANLSSEQAPLVARAADHARFVDRWALLPSSQNHVQLAWLGLLSGRPGRFEAHIKRATELAPADTALRADLASFLTARRRFDEAGGLYSQAIRIDANNPKLYYNYGISLALRGDVQGAIEQFETALQLDADFLEARENLAGMLCQAGRYEAGIEQYQRALEQNPDDAGTHVLLARAYERLGQSQRAQKHYRRASELHSAPDKGHQEERAPSD